MQLQSVPSRVPQPTSTSTQPILASSRYMPSGAPTLTRTPKAVAAGILAFLVPPAMLSGCRGTPPGPDGMSAAAEAAVLRHLGSSAGNFTCEAIPIDDRTVRDTPNPPRAEVSCQRKDDPLARPTTYGVLGNSDGTRIIKITPRVQQHYHNGI